MDLIRDSLFSIQVKQPWLLLQYEESDIETLGSDRVESLLSASPDTDDREDVVIEEIEDKDNDNLTRKQENVRTQVVRESTSTANKQSAPTTRQTVQRQKQTKTTVQKKTKNKSTVNKSTSRKGGKK